MTRLTPHIRSLLLGWLLVSPAVGGNDIAATGHRAEADPNHQLQQILKKPIYQRWRLRLERQSHNPILEHDSVLVGYLRQWSRSIVEAIKRFWNWLPSMPRPSGFPSWNGGTTTLVSVMKTVAWVLLAIVTLFLAVMVYRSLRLNRHSGEGGRVLDREKIRRAMDQGQALAMGGEAWLEEAEKLEHHGDLRSVYRALYLGLLSGLHRRGKIDFRRNRTNWTYVTRFNGPRDQRHLFADLTQLFDNVWYGLAPAGVDDLGPVRDKIKHLIRTGQD